MGYRTFLLIFYFVSYLAVLSSASSGTNSKLMDIKKDDNTNTEKLVSVEDQVSGKKSNLTVEQIKENTKIKEKYKVMSELMSEIIPGMISTNRTEAYYKFLKRFKKNERRRKKKQKRCDRKHTILEKWLSRQLFTVQKKNNKVLEKKICQSKIQKNDSFNDEMIFGRDFKREDDEVKKRWVISRYCNNKGTVENDGTVKLCTECYVQHDLGPRRYPRYLNEIECGSYWPQDFFCLSGEGVCAAKEIYIKFRFDRKNKGFAHLYEWDEYLQPIKVGCNCQLMQSSIFTYFI